MARIDNIAFVCPRFAEGPTVGGAETLLKTLAMYAATRGRNVTFLTTCARNHFTWRNERPPGRETFGGIDVTFFPVDENRDVSAFLCVQNKISRGRRISPEDEMVWLKNSVNSSELCEHLRTGNGRYDAIIAGPYLFGLTFFAAKIHPDRTMLVPCLHDEPFAYLGAFREMFRSVSGCLFNTEPERDLATEMYGPEFGTMPVVGMGIEPFEADPEASSREYGISSPYVVYCGRREPLKGTPLLIDYIQAFRTRSGRDVKLLLTGTGPIDMPSQLRPHVLDAGFVSEAKKHEIMAGATAFCHPSVNESLGIVLLESWLARTPAVVHAGSKVLRYQCRHSNGGLWFHSYPEFEESFLRLLDDGPLRKAMGEAGRAYVLREYSHEVIADKLVAAIEGGRADVSSDAAVFDAADSP